MKQGVNKNGVEYLELEEDKFLCKLYLGEGVELEKIIVKTFDEIKKINLDDMLNK